jgi:hypothetical protein
LHDIGGGSLLRAKHSGSPYSLLSEVYPEFDWLPWKFVKSPTNSWEIKKIQNKFLEYATEKLNIKESSDWYKVTRKVKGKIKC